MNDIETQWVLRLIEEKERSYNARFESMENAVKLAHGDVRFALTNVLSAIAIITAVIVGIIEFVRH